MIYKTRPVLVADDDEYFRLAVAALLKGPLGFTRVIETGSLDEALEQLSATEPGICLALFDLSMPGMEGPATLGAVRECHPDVSVAVVSASQNRQDVLVALETGVHGYIPKGFGPNELIRALKIIIEGDIFVPAFLAQVSASDRRTSQSGRLGRPSMFADPNGGGSSSATEKNNTGQLLASISPRQREVLALLVKGSSNKQIANELSLGEGTIKIHVAALLRNLGVSNRAGAAAMGARLLEA